MQSAQHPGLMLHISITYPKPQQHVPQNPTWEQRGNRCSLCCTRETFSSLLTTCKPLSENFLK